jgi:hypothetical protein
VANAQNASMDFLNHNQPVLDAHNCYPKDNVKRALDSGFPVSIEQDLSWYVDPSTGKGRVVVTHSSTPTGSEPTLRDYFFEQVRPTVEKALAENKRDQWPLIVLHFDFKTTQPELLEAVWQLLGEYEPWLSTAVKTANPETLSPFDRKPILAITEDSDEQAKIFFDKVPVGARLRVFGSAHTYTPPAGPPEQQAHWKVTAPPEQLFNDRPTNYRRWWNSPWNVVEEGGQNHAGEWTKTDDQRLQALVNHAHKLGYWIRFYTLDGFDAPDPRSGSDYNFGSKDDVVPRWKAAIADGVNFIATDQYEDLATYLKQPSRDMRPSSSVSRGH